MNQFIQSTVNASAVGTKLPVLINVNNIAYAKEDSKGTFLVFTAKAESAALYLTINMPYSEFIEKVTKS